MLGFCQQRSDDGGHKRLQKSPECFIDLWKNHSMASGKDRGPGLPRSRIARGPAAAEVDRRLDGETATTLRGILGQMGEDGENSGLPDAGHRAVRRNLRTEWRFQVGAGVAESSAKGMLIAVPPGEHALTHSSDIDAPFPITPGLLVWEEATLPITTGKPDLFVAKAIGTNLERMCPVAHVRGTDREQGIDVVVSQSGLRVSVARHDGQHSNSLSVVAKASRPGYGGGADRRPRRLRQTAHPLENGPLSGAGVMSPSVMARKPMRSST